MDMLGGPNKSYSRIATAAALGLTLGGYAMSTPAKAADLGGDCCADLEERVAELEATTVRKGNKKVTVTVSGWVVKTMNWWDDGGGGNFAVGDKDYDLGSRLNISGSATIAPGWSGGYNLTILAPADVFGFAANQFNDLVNNNVSTLYSYIYVKSDTWGTLNWGTLSPASDNAAVLADISGTVIESNGPWFEGPGFFLRPSGNNGLAALTWTSFLSCNALGAGIGVDCWGAAQPAVRYDTPTFGGFRVETSYGTNTFSGAGVIPSSSNNFWDIAAFYNGDWGDFKVSAAYSYTWVETAVFTSTQSDINQAGATVMHVPTGLGLYGMYQNEDAAGAPTTDAWYLKPFIKRTWNPLGATILYGEWARYDDQYASLVGADICAAGGFGAGTGVGSFCGGNAANTVAVNGSEMERFGLGVVQEIDSAAMHLFARWQHQDADVDFVGTNVNGVNSSVRQDFENWDLFQLGGIIFF
jgi:predicted porin